MYGNEILNELNRRSSERKLTWKITVDHNEVEVKATTIHNLVKRYARSVFK